MGLWPILLFSQSDNPLLFSIEVQVQVQEFIQHNINILRNQAKFEKYFWF